MNSKQINVELITENERELLVFNFDKKISLDLTSDDKDALKEFFQQLLKEIINQDIDLNFVETDRSDLFYDVAKKYVEHLKIELLSITSQKLNHIDPEVDS